MEMRTPRQFFSTLTGIITAIFMLASLADRELFPVVFDVFGITLGFGLSAIELVIPLTALIADLGMYYALKTYLKETTDPLILHLFLPLAVTLTIGVSLRNLGSGLTGWGLLFITAALLYLVLRFEFISCDPASAHRALSIIVLDSLCYTVFLLFVITLRANVIRPVICLGSILILCFVVSVKIYSFHVVSFNVPIMALVTTMMMIFSDAGLRFCPINIVSYGSLMFIWYYTFTAFLIGADREEPIRSVLLRILPVEIPALLVLTYSLIKI